MAVAENLSASADTLKTARVSRRDVPTASSAPSARRYFVVLSLIGLVAFVLGVGNRFTADSLFLVAPQVDFFPPLSAGPWNAAYAVHQQDPVFAACGGTESLALFKMLYWWEWLRRAALVGLGGVALAGLMGAAVWRRFAFALPRLNALATLALAYWPARAALEFALGASATMSSFNAGQYRHALDVLFASAVLAGAIASALAPPRAERAAARRPARREWIWVAAILVDIGFGALFAARDAAASWPTLLGYEGHALPPFAQLVSYSPWWLNLSFNALTIQLVHRGLSLALWIGAAVQLAAAVRARAADRALVRFGLITLQMLLGILTLALGVPPALSIAHQVGAVVLLAASLAFLMTGEAAASADVRAPPNVRWRTT